ncbi:MAG TPA: DNA polymerase III subunit epsilon [Stellaceae bacterium]|nr:DNA polymerase III subunit epsilon [Stellaceae bacterium]
MAAALAEEPRRHLGRVIVLDTETTGLDPAAGHRIVEVACIELVNLVPTGRELHFYCNPERDMPEDALAVHGLTADFLGGHKTFAEEAARLTEFLALAEALVAHNAPFDVAFLDAELTRCGLPRLACDIVDTVALARRKFPGAPASLDALCRRFAVDLSQRSKHGARLYAELLATVYLELIGGRQPGLDFAVQALNAAAGGAVERVMRPPRPHAPSDAELAAHEAFLAKLKSPLWLAEE